MLRRALPLLPVVLLAPVAGCPRRVDHDAGIPVDGPIGADAGPGNDFVNPIVLSDERVRLTDPSTLPAGATPCREPVLARVHFVRDGDTIEVLGEDIVLDVPVRLIGVDTPETTTSACYSAEAAAFTGQLDEHLVWLTFDNTCFDSFNRLLAYVYVGGGDGDLWQRQLLRRGFATTLFVGDNRAFETQFSADQDQASGSGEGLWSACF